MATDSVNERTRRRLREQARLSLDVVGGRAGIAASIVSRLESGARRLTLDHLPPLARALGVTVDALLAAPEHTAPASAAAPSPITASRSAPRGVLANRRWNGRLPS